MLTANGDLNTYALFAEQFTSLIAHNGRSGLIVPSGIATDFSYRAYYQEIVNSRKLISMLGFDNALRIFPSVHPDTPFSLITLGASKTDPEYAHYILEIQILRTSDAVSVSTRMIFR